MPTPTLQHSVVAFSARGNLGELQPISSRTTEAPVDRVRRYRLSRLPVQPRCTFSDSKQSSRFIPAHIHPKCLRRDRVHKRPPVARIPKGVDAARSATRARELRTTSGGRTVSHRAAGSRGLGASLESFASSQRTP